jgi:hypothetical protein
MQRSLLAAAFAAWLSLEPSIRTSEHDSMEWKNANMAEEEEEEEEEEGFISFLQKTIVATMEATKEIGLKGTF